MNILVCTKISIPAKDRTLPAWEYVRSLDHTVTIDCPNRDMNKPDVIISMGVTVMEETFKAVEIWPDVPLYCYGWDCYDWCTDNPRRGEYNYSRYYEELLPRTTEVWMASNCTGRKMELRWGVHNWCRILSACPWWEHKNIRDDGYILCALREIPDTWWGMLEQVCGELNLPLKMTKHKATYEQYQDAVAGCRFICSPLYELSTGGLTLMEGYYHGKPCLLSDSEWHGGRDYMGDRAEYFNHMDKQNFRDKLVDMYNNPPVLNLSDCKQWIHANYSDKRMMDDMLRRIDHHAKLKVKELK